MRPPRGHRRALEAVWPPHRTVSQAEAASAPLTPARCLAAVQSRDVTGWGLGKRSPGQELTQSLQGVQHLGQKIRDTGTLGICWGHAPTHRTYWAHDRDMLGTHEDTRGPTMDMPGTYERHVGTCRGHTRDTWGTCGNIQKQGTRESATPQEQEEKRKRLQVVLMSRLGKGKNLSFLAENLI